jgi:DNA-nicking Smr family endonuclease
MTHDEDDVVEMEITGELDLHTFSPKDVSSLVPDYLDACVERGIRDVRIVHGKGAGVLRRMVHAALDRHPKVISYRLGDQRSGSWGATLVVLDVEPAR